MTARVLNDASNKGKRIPIPSFAPCGTSSNDVEAMNHHETTVARSFISWNKEILLRIEGALQMLFRTSSRQNNWFRESKISINDFCNLVEQLRSSYVPTTDADSNLQNMIVTPERLLHDLLYVGSPSLYQLIPAEDSTKTKECCLQVVAFSGNRMEELRRLLQQAPTDCDRSKSKPIQDMLNQHRLLFQKNPAADSIEPSPKQAPQKIVLEPYIRPDMNLEQRVRARADARQQRQPTENGAATDSNVVMTDPSKLLRLADALWSHSRHILRRQVQRMAMTTTSSSEGSSKPKCCCITVKDILALLSGSLKSVATGTSTAMPQRGSSYQKVSRKEMLLALHGLQRSVPEWISFSDPKLSEYTTVWIQSVTDYAAIRTRLGAPQRTVLDTKRPLLETSLPNAPPVSLAPTPPLQPSSPENDEAQDVQPNVKRQKSEAYATRTTLKRPAENPIVSPMPVKKKVGLRINPNLILTDADYNGGTILVPTMEESPRGLKRLFSQLNSGHRI